MSCVIKASKDKLIKLYVHIYKSLYSYLDFKINLLLRNCKKMSYLPKIQSKMTLNLHN